MAEHAAARPSTATKARRDKECPFCHQIFTSSSLGRHLDLYIRPHNPKPPDGVHVVDEIRRIRSGITRRQIRPLRRVSSAASSQAQTQSSNGLFGEDGDHSMFHSFSRPNRPSTEMPHGFSPRQRSRSALGATEKAQHQQQKRDLDRRKQSSEEQDNLKATEYALKEVLMSFRGGNIGPSGLGLFDFDPFTLDFPSLCLHVLTPPPTLFSLTPFATSDSWSIAPPGQKQFDALIRNMRERVHSYQRQRQSQHVQSPTPTDCPGAGPRSSTPPLLELGRRKLLTHVADTFAHWKTLPEKQRQDAWQLEILRAYSTAERSRASAEVALEKAWRDLEHMAVQFEELAKRSGIGPPHYRAQENMTQTSSATLYPGLDTTRDFDKPGQSRPRWEYTQLIEKWKAIIRDHQKTHHGIAAQRSLSITTGFPGIFTPMHTPRHLLSDTSGMSAPASAVTSFPSQPLSERSSAGGTAPTSDDEADDDAEGDADVSLPGESVHKSSSAQMTSEQLCRAPCEHRNQRDTSSQWETHPSLSQIHGERSAQISAGRSGHPSEQVQQGRTRQPHHVPSSRSDSNARRGPHISHLELGDSHHDALGLGHGMSMDGIEVSAASLLGRIDMPMGLGVAGP